LFLRREKMEKQQEKKATRLDGQFFVFGLDAEGKPRGARFTEFNERALSFALSLGLIGVHPASAKFVELGMKLPPGRIYSSGKGFIPNVRRDLVKGLTAVLASAGDESQKHQQSGTAPPVAAGLPRSWDQIAVGQLVLATGDEPQDGFWECIVEGREDQVLTLRLRDYPEQGTYVRHLAQVALLHPGLE
jgi:hypothetical protein